MALDPYDKARVAKSALGMIAETRARLIQMGRPNDPIVLGNLARRLQRAFGELPGANYAAFQVIARQSINGARQGDFMNTNRGMAVLAPSLSVDPSILPGDPQFRYAILVTRTNYEGRSVSSQSVIRSDVPLTAEQVQGMVAERVEEHDSARRSTRRAIAMLGSETTLTVTILTAGKAGP